MSQAPCAQPPRIRTDGQLGRPPGPARQAILQALACACGDFEALARTACLPVPQVRTTLKNLRRERVVCVDSQAPSPLGAPRPRAVYGCASEADREHTQAHAAHQLQSALRAWGRSLHASQSAQSA